MFTAFGKLRYGYTNVVLDVEQDLSDYYRKLLPKYISHYLQRQAYDAHISVVRKEFKEPDMKEWGKYEGEIIEFSYSNIIRANDTYAWIDAWSKRLEQIREGLGLGNERPAHPNGIYYDLNVLPEGFNKTFHITIGNWKWMKSVAD